MKFDWKVLVMLGLALIVAWQLLKTDKLDLSVYENKIELLEGRNDSLVNSNKELLDSNLVLAAERKELIEEREDLYSTISTLNIERDGLRSENEKLKNRRDEAIKYVNGLSDDELIKFFSEYLTRRQ